MPLQPLCGMVSSAKAKALAKAINPNKGIVFAIELFMKSRLDMAAFLFSDFSIILLILAPISTPFIYNIGIQRKKDVGVCTSAYLGSWLSHCPLTEISNAASPRRDVCVYAHTLHCGLPQWGGIAKQCRRIWHTLSSSGRSPVALPSCEFKFARFGTGR